MVVSEPAIRLSRVTLHYGGDEVVRDVGLAVQRGETKVILGPSGVGKSTLLKAMLGLLRPKSGQISILGTEIARLAERDLVRLRLRMAMVFQHGALFDSMNVSENVSFRLREFGLAEPEEIEKRVNEVLRFVGLQGARKLKPAQLSGGMKKRVAIARALAPDPDIFLFDEPTVGLDPINQHNTEQIILKLKEKKDRTLVIVTHDVASALRLADSIVMLHEGRFIFEGAPEALMGERDPRVRGFLEPARLKI